MSKSEINYNWIMHRAYIRSGKIVHTGDAVTLACLVHAKGSSRKGEDMQDLQKIMGDPNRRK